MCWALGISRKTDHPLYVQFNGGWINTDAMVHDANTAGGLFICLTAPRVGCLVVYGALPPRRKVGHVGIVTGIEPSHAGARATRVLHCSHGNHRTLADAVIETDLRMFSTPDAVFVGYHGAGMPDSASD